MYVCVCVYMCVYMHLYIYMCVCVRGYARTLSCISPIQKCCVLFSLYAIEKNKCKLPGPGNRVAATQIFAAEQNYQIVKSKNI